LYSSTSTVISGTEWDIGGFTIDFQFLDNFQFLSVYNPINVNAGTLSTPLSIQITIAPGTVLSTPLTIYNVTDGTRFRLDTSWVAWDVFIIDSASLTCTKNGVNIIWLRQAWSIRPYATGTTQIVIIDNDWWMIVSDTNVVITFRNVLM
jgi:hypothetical protein